MHIPLDYYRILGVPIQATTGQLQQAYHDRTLQLPRREYSERAISSRKQLLDEAYEVLSDSKQRSDYDGNFLAKTYELEGIKPHGNPTSPESGNLEKTDVEPHSPSIEISPEQLVGALMVLQELGEYELVLKLGTPALNNLKSNTSGAEMSEKSPVLRSDVVLTLALAYLELCREQWQQNQYEQAAKLGQGGQDLLLAESLFPSVRSEIEADLYRLRPYRILELVASQGDQQWSRQKGLQVLREMLADRGGIDGTGNDESGLSIDDFLRFIQQLRGYLTAAEQQDLFEAEARRPSAVASYLAVYALLGSGFAHQKPELIARAKDMLIWLGRRQDVHLEQAVCALLLGQTEAATRALELSQEYEPLAFIREHSVGSPDLLPGLCLYGEKWLQTEVFPHFRDLSQYQTSLKEYFADEGVQRYLEGLPVETTASQWSTAQGSHVNSGESAYAQIGYQAQGEVGTVGGTTLTVERPTQEAKGDYAPDNVTYFSDAQQKRNRRRRRREKHADSGDNDNGQSLDFQLLASQVKRSSGKLSFSSPAVRILILILVSILGLGLAGFVVFKTIQWLQKTTQNLSGGGLQGEQLVISLNEPLITIPEAKQSRGVIADGALTNEVATQVVQAWLDLKKEAFSQKYQAENLKNILSEPMLSTWLGRVQKAKSGGEYRQYNHGLTVQNVNYSESIPNEGIVDAAVKEVSKSFRGGVQTNSENDNLRVRYYLVRRNKQWFIRNSEVLR